MSDRVNETVAALFATLVLPPFKGGSEAARLLGLSAPLIQRQLRQEVFSHPLGWRSLRVVSVALRHCMMQTWADGPTRSTQNALIDLVRDVLQYEMRCFYRSRSLVIEAVRYIPPDPWFTEEMRRRAADGTIRPDAIAAGESGNLPIRERQYAAIVYWLRASGLEHLTGEADVPVFNPLDSAGDRPAVPPGTGRDDLLHFVDQLANDEHPGIRWVAAVLGFLVEGIRPPYIGAVPADAPAAVRARWEESGKPVVDLVNRAVADPALGARLTPDQWTDELRSLVIHAAVMCDGTARRNILDAIWHAGRESDAALMFNAIIEAARSKSGELGWLIEQCLFCMSYQGGSADAQSDEIWPVLAREAGLQGGPEMPIVPADRHDQVGRSIRMTALMGLADVASRYDDPDDPVAGELARAMHRRLWELVEYTHTTQDETLNVKEPLSVKEREVLQIGDDQRFDFILKVGGEIRALVFALSMLRHESSGPLLTQIANGEQISSPSSPGTYPVADLTTRQIARWGARRIQHMRKLPADWVRLTFPSTVMSDFLRPTADGSPSS